MIHRTVPCSNFGPLSRSPVKRFCSVTTHKGIEYWDLTLDAYSHTDQELSKKNTENRKQQKYHYKRGAKPFIQHAKKAQKNGTQLSLIDNWETLLKNKDQWINDVARAKHDEMKGMRGALRDKLIQEAPEGTQPDSIQVPLDVEIGIMGQKLGKKGRSIRGVGDFPCMERSTSSTMATGFELTEIHDRLKLLSTNFHNMQKENEELRAQLRVILNASQGQTRSKSFQQHGNFEDDDYYDELAEHEDLQD